jgi:hypothetical protein
MKLHDQKVQHKGSGRYFPLLGRRWWVTKARKKKKKKVQLPCIFDTHNDFNIGAALLCGFAKLTALLALSLGVVLGMEFSE